MQMLKERGIAIFLSSKGLQRTTKPELAIRDEPLGQRTALNALVLRKPAHLALHERAVYPDCGLMSFQLLKRPGKIP